MGDRDMKVCSLMTENQKSWDHEKVANLFCPDEARQILAIPLSVQSLQDRLIWQHSKTGIFTVKTAYHVACDMASNNSPASASSSRPTDWKWPWKLHIPPKIKFFVWKMINNLLPVGFELIKRKVDVNSICCRCGSMVETAEHALRDCEWSKQFWYFSCLRISISNSDSQVQLWEWIDKMKELLPIEALPIFCCFAWYIWFARNSVIFQKQQFDIATCLAKAQRILLEFEDANRRFTDNQSSIGEDHPRTLNHCCFRITSDAAIREQRGCGLGVVIWDNHGQVCAAKIQNVEMLRSPEVAEALACRLGIQLAISLDIQQVQIETDCLSLVQKLKSGAQDCTEFGEIIADIQHLCSSFCYFHFLYVPRSDNKVAHSLAKFSFSISSADFLWMNALPFEVLHDVNIL